MNINSKGLALIQAYEGCRLTAYRCPAGILTIGYGSTREVREGQTITQEQADDLLRDDLTFFENHMTKALEGIEYTSNQFSACVSLMYNIGVAAFLKSSVLRRMKDGDFAGAADAFLMWNKAGGRELAGLTRRRKAERKLFLMKEGEDG